MRRLGLGGLALLCAAVSSALASAACCDSPACVILSARDARECTAAIAAIEAGGGAVRHAFPPGVLICDLDDRSESSAKSLPSVRSILRNAADPQRFPDLDSCSRLGLEAWNSLCETSIATTQARFDAVMPIDDALPAPDAPPMLTQPAAQDSSGGPTSYQTSEFMIGKIAVAIVMPQSIGGTETWSSDRQSSVIGKIVMGMDWWVAKAAPSANLTIYYDVPPKNLGVACSVEPVSQPSYLASSWITEVMGNLGYPGSDMFALTRQYINDVRQRYDTDWAFCVFVVDSLNDTDGSFSDSRFSIAYRMGPMVIMTYDCGTWGLSRMDLVFRHEVGHIFGAADEYCSPGYSCCDFGSYGYLNVVNSNCANGNPQSVACVMKDNSNNLCQSTREQIGWRDSDGDGIFDPVDTQVSCSLVPQAPGPTGVRSFVYKGSAHDVPCDSPVRTEVTINRITKVEYDLDGHGWLPASAIDGAFDSPSEEFSFQIQKVAAGHHSVSVRAYNTVGNVSNVASDSVTVLADPTPPIGVSVQDDGVYTNSVHRLHASWTASDPDTGIGEYQYAVGTSPTDPGTGYVSGWTSAGTRTSAEVRLPLVLGQTYYFYVRAANGDGVWSDVAVSDGITVELAFPIGAIKLLPDGTMVAVDYAVVTAALPDGVAYVEDDDRVSGLRLVSGVSLQPGDRIRALGVVKTTPAGERYVQVSLIQIVCQNEIIPSPLAIDARHVGGGPFGPFSSGPQSYGLNNVGMYVKTWGEVAVTGTGCFYIDVSAKKAPRFAKVLWDGQIGLGQFIVADGIVSLEAASEGANPIAVLIALQVTAP